MNIFRKYTRKSLSNNKVRTLVTIIGIILSVSLFTAVVEGLASARNYAVRITAATIGYYEAAYDNADGEMLNVIENDDRIKNVAALESIGFGDIGSSNSGKPYLYVGAMTDDFTDLVAVRLTEGRMPGNSQEIILPKHLYTNGSVEKKLGDEISIEAGKRECNGEMLMRNAEYMEGEKIVDLRQVSYTVVGFYERLDYGIEGYSCPGYMALTKSDSMKTADSAASDGTASDGTAFNGTIFFTVNNQRELDDIMEEYIEYDDHYSGTDVNRQILAYSGITNDGGLWSVMYTLVVMLFALIMFGSVALIYNSFSISLSERTRQFGILKSVGATRKQIMGTVIYEAVLLCLIAIPIGIIVGCTGIGITLYSLQDTFKYLFARNDYGGVLMNLYIEPKALVLAAVLGLVTTLISALIPAMRAVRITAIDAVRQTSDVKISGKKLKTSRLTQKLFGLAGMLAAKNFKRNRKKYRATVISLFVSVVLFISASSFVAYLNNSVDVVANDADYDVMISYDSYNNVADGLDDMYKQMSSIKGVTESAMIIEDYVNFELDADMFSDEYIKLNHEEFEGDPTDPMYKEDKYYFDKNQKTVNLSLVFVDDQTYSNVLKENGISLDELQKNSGILYDNSMVVEHYEDGDVRNVTSIFRSDQFPLTLDAEDVKSVDGYEYDYSRIVTDSEGNVTGEEYMYRPENINYENYDEEKDGLVLSEEEALVKQPVTIGAVMKKRPFFKNYQTFILYPKSAMYAMNLGDSMYPSFYFKADNHNYVSDEITRIVTSTDRKDGVWGIQDRASDRESSRSVILIINVFSYGFIILISLIAIANIFNTVSTNILLRRREFAMLKSVGMSSKGSMKMMNYECILYGVKGLIYGIPVAILITFFIYYGMEQGVPSGFFIPWYSIVISVGSVFVVVFATMLYAMGKVKKDNPVDALKDENL